MNLTLSVGHLIDSNRSVASILGQPIIAPLVNLHLRRSEKLAISINPGANESFIFCSLGKKKIMIYHNEGFLSIKERIHTFV